MTKIINLYGGPSCGKSATASYLFYLLKKNNKKVELVQEYVKEWVWEDRKINPFDQIYFFGKQVRKESMLFGKVDYVITDSPVLLSLCYIQKCCDSEIFLGLKETVKAFYHVAPKHNVEHIHILLKRPEYFEKSGRIHSEEESIKIDSEIEQLFKDFNYNYIKSSYMEDDLNMLYRKIVK